MTTSTNFVLKMYYICIPKYHEKITQKVTIMTTKAFKKEYDGI